MSSVPGAPLPLDGPPSPPSNPWTLLALAGGAVTAAAGIVAVLVGVSQQNRYDASAVPLIAGAALLGAAALLLCSALVLAGVGWHLRHSPLPIRREGA